MTIKQQGGIFGRNPSYNEVDANELNVDNIKIDGNAITSTDTNGDIGLNPNGTGSLLIGNNGQADYVAAKIRKKFNGSVSVQFDGGGDTAYADFRMDGSENLALRLDPSNTLNDQTFSVSHNGSNIAQFIGSSGDLKVNTGNLVIGTSGQGIDFSATSDGSGTTTSELFDDYEEGTWTPVLADASSGGNEASYANNTGYYTKIGRNVYCTFNLQSIDTTGMTSGNNIHIRGLPFSVINIAGDTQNFSQNAVCINVTAAHTPYITFDDGTDFMYLLEWDGTSAGALLKISDITSGTGRIMCSFWYTSY